MDLYNKDVLILGISSGVKGLNISKTLISQSDNGYVFFNARDNGFCILFERTSSKIS